ncbi:MAG: hypothetical protein DYH02_00795 [Candidatus Omnitrophica bacterium COP1]|jgi:hypothetical protein|nr:hypothetical protein [Candidatus Omnitrophica bacterium COP1]
MAATRLQIGKVGSDLIFRAFSKKMPIPGPLEDPASPIENEFRIHFSINMSGPHNDGRIPPALRI